MCTTRVLVQSVEITSDADDPFLFFPPGHFYSPLPNKAELESVRARVFGKPVPKTLPGVDLRINEQLQLYAELAQYHADFPFPEERDPNLLFFLQNSFFGHADAYWLYAILRHFSPRRVIEIGSGFSSCVTIDTANLFMSKKPALTFIEPHLERLQGLLKGKDQENITLIPQKVQEVPLEVFDQLESGDILFIDSSHVGKIGSDVLYELFEILPRLKPGVLVHFHDIVWPFEYPEEWVTQGIAWNEAYFLHAFLQFNKEFEIMLWGNYVVMEYFELMKQKKPVCCKNGGASFGIRRASAQQNNW